MLSNVVKIYVENDFVSTLSNVVQTNVEIDNVNLMLFNIGNLNVDIHNVASTLIWRCATSRRHVNLNTTLKRSWNVYWEVTTLAILKIIEQNIQIEPGCHLYCTACKLVLLSHLAKIARLFNDHILFQECAP